MVAGPFGFTQTFGYDKAGNRVSVTDNKGGTTASAFDPDNRLVTRTFTDGTTQARLDYAYTARDQVQAVTRSADLAGTALVGTSAYSYDDGGRVTGITHKDATAAPLAAYAYQYDAADRLTQKTENGAVTAYGYDAVGQLTQDGATSYSYDAAGNRTTATVSAGNRVSADGGWAWAYDPAGQPTGKAAGGASWGYEYDHRGQLVAAERAGGGRVTYRYDALGNRVGRTEAAAGGAVVSDERYALDGWDPADPATAGRENFDAVADLDAAGGVTARRVFADGFDTLGVRVDAAGAGWYLADRQGSVRLVTDGTGAVTGGRSYTGFGAEASEAGTGLDRYGWTGREVDDATGLQFNRARWYDAGGGRWLGEDPARWAAGDANLYRYAGNGPTNATDPSGESLLIPDRPEDREFWSQLLGPGNYSFGGGNAYDTEISIGPGARTREVHDRVANGLRAAGYSNEAIRDIMIYLYDGDLTQPQAGFGRMRVDVGRRLAEMRAATLHTAFEEVKQAIDYIDGVLREIEAALKKLYAERSQLRHDEAAWLGQAKTCDPSDKLRDEAQRRIADRLAEVGEGISLLEQFQAELKKEREKLTGLLRRLAAESAEADQRLLTLDAQDRNRERYNQETELRHGRQELEARDRESFAGLLSLSVLLPSLPDLIVDGELNFRWHRLFSVGGLLMSVNEAFSTPNVLEGAARLFDGTPLGLIIPGDVFRGARELGRGNYGSAAVRLGPTLVMAAIMRVRAGGPTCKAAAKPGSSCRATDPAKVGAARTPGSAGPPSLPRGGNSQWSSAAGDLVVSGSNLPGAAGVQVGRRVTVAEMEALTDTFGVEFSLVYRLGPGPNGAGGRYFLYSGGPRSVDVPIGRDVIWIYHTHPRGVQFASGTACDGKFGDMDSLRLLQRVGSPQKSSRVIPVNNGPPVRYDVTNNGVDRPNRSGGPDAR